MLEAIAILLVCQLLGESIVIALDIPLPGPVIGMAILFFGLMIYGKVPDSLSEMTKGLLGQLSLLFVPAGVGVMTHLTLLGEEWIPITTSLVISTLVTLGVTGLMMQKLVSRADKMAFNAQSTIHDRSHDPSQGDNNTDGISQNSSKENLNRSSINRAKNSDKQLSNNELNNERKNEQKGEQKKGSDDE